MNVNEIFQTIVNLTGDKEIAGFILYTLTLIFIASLTYKKSLFLTLLLIIPTTLIFTKYGILSTELAALLCLISALCISLTARQVIK